MNNESINNIKELANLIKISKKTMVLTGAGISTNSGIPDFRSKETGLWNKVDPMKYLTKKILLNEPEKFYKYVYREDEKNKISPKPNRGHIIIAELEKRKLIDGVITQNVDNLHFDGGSKIVYEVHGNVKDGYCLECGQYISEKEIKNKVLSKEIPPRCNNCGDIVRTSVILFGDELPEEFTIAKKEVEKSDLLLVIGSSLEVSPVNHLPKLAKEIVIINREKTKMDSMARFTIKEDITEALEELIRII